MQQPYAGELILLDQDNKKKLEEPEFVKIYRKNVPELRWLMTNHQFASALLFFILEHMDQQNVLACSYSVFESYFGKHKTTIYRNLKILQDHGFIHSYKMGTSNVYAVNTEIAFPENGHFAKYLGNILISKHENKDHIAQELLKTNRTEGHKKQIELMDHEEEQQ